MSIVGFIVLPVAEEQYQSNAPTDKLSIDRSSFLVAKRSDSHYDYKCPVLFDNLEHYRVTMITADKKLI